MNDTIDDSKLKYYMGENVWCKAESLQLLSIFTESHEMMQIHLMMIMSKLHSCSLENMRTIRLNEYIMESLSAYSNPSDVRVRPVSVPFHGFLTSCNVAVIASLRVPCVCFGLNLVVPPYISTYFGPLRQRFYTERQTGIYSTEGQLILW
jgi:hypothetical protein